MRFKEKKDHYLDNKTGLKWSKENFGPISWEAAMESLPEGWRLPTIDELLSIVDDAKHDPATELADMLSSGYWSSTTYTYDADYAWLVGFYSGYFYDNDVNKSNSYYVRAVRDEKEEINAI